MNNQEKLSFGSKIIIADRAIGNILDLFSNTFLSAYFYKLTKFTMLVFAKKYNKNDVRRNK